MIISFAVTMMLLLSSASEACRFDLVAERLKDAHCVRVADYLADSPEVGAGGIPFQHVKLRAGRNLLGECIEGETLEVTRKIGTTSICRDGSGEFRELPERGLAVVVTRLDGRGYPTVHGLVDDIMVTGRCPLPPENLVSVVEAMALVMRSESPSGRASALLPMLRSPDSMMVIGAMATIYASYYWKNATPIALQEILPAFEVAIQRVEPQHVGIAILAAGIVGKKQALGEDSPLIAFLAAQSGEGAGIDRQNAAEALTAVRDSQARIHGGASRPAAGGR